MSVKVMLLIYMSVSGINDCMTVMVLKEVNLYILYIYLRFHNNVSKYKLLSLCYV